MRKLFVVLAVVALAMLLTPSCARNRTETMVSPNAYLAVSEGTVAVTVTQAGSECKEETRCASVLAIHRLLFVGVPGSAVPRAMVADETAARTQHASFFRQLFEQAGYTRYVQSVRAESAGAGSAPDTSVWTVVINYEALRIALEKEGVIRKFGY